MYIKCNWHDAVDTRVNIALISCVPPARARAHLQYIYIFIFSKKAKQKSVHTHLKQISHFIFIFCCYCVRKNFCHLFIFQVIFSKMCFFSTLTRSLSFCLSSAVTHFGANSGCFIWTECLLPLFVFGLKSGIVVERKNNTHTHNETSVNAVWQADVLIFFFLLLPFALFARGKKNR